LNEVKQSDSYRETFRKSDGLFAIRQFLKEVPSTNDIIFSENLRKVLDRLFRSKFFVVKSIFFDKPQSYNLYVSCHQDLTIFVDKKISLNGFDFWTKKQNQFSVQPPLYIFQNIVTVRIHLDDTDRNNGAL